MRLPAGFAVLVLAAAAASACHSGAPSRAAEHHRARPAAQAETPPPEPSPAYSSQFRNLQLSAKVRRQLVATFARKSHVPVRGYVGLTPGLSYYGYDVGAKTFWAAGRPVPSSSSLPAQTSLNDEGFYAVFWRPNGKPWRIALVGGVGPDMRACAWMPRALDDAWGWSPGACRPATGGRRAADRPTASVSR